MSPGRPVPLLVCALCLGLARPSVAMADAPFWTPQPGTTWQIQITGKVDETVPVEVYDVDLFEAEPGELNAGVVDRLHARGVKVVCYVDSGAWESYRPDAKEFPRSVIGGSTGWPGERWLDLRPTRWQLFAHLIWRRFDWARALGCDGVDPDENDPIGNRPGFPITRHDVKAWYLEVARQAHRRGLAVGMKNGVELIDADLVRANQWTVNEQCFEFAECAPLRRFVEAGKAVFQIEYEPMSAAACRRSARLGFSSLVKRLSLDAWRKPCPSGS